MLDQSAADGLWGDGFAGDSAQAGARVTRWDQLCPDEYVRFFPGLAGDAPGRPDLAAFIARSVSARAWRLRHRHGRPGLPASASASDQDDDRRGRTAHAQLFAREPLWRRWMPRPPSGAASPRALAEEDDLHALLRLRQDLGEDGAGEPDAGSLASFAFLVGIHPGNLWRSAFAAHETLATAGWLGVVARGRRALMPPEVAGVLVDVVQPRRGAGVAVLDPALARMIGSEDHAARLRHGALKCRAGAEVIHRRPWFEARLAPSPAHRPIPGEGIGSLARP